MNRIADYELYWNNEEHHESFTDHDEAVTRAESLVAQGIKEIYLAHMDDDGGEVTYETFGGDK